MSNHLFPSCQFRFIVTEIDLVTYEHTNHYLFSPDGYREIISSDSFFSGLKRRNRSNFKLYNRTWIDEVIGGLFDKSKVDAINHKTAIECKNLFDFYKKIGYDRYLKKYVQ